MTEVLYLWRYHKARVNRILVLFSTRFIKVMTVLIVGGFYENIKLIAEVVVRNKLFMMLAQT